eukprot:Hpha_TRINITY_DN15166_c3_g1::TRINITY_DN15166_c3_g1_i1::g.130050::m.130050
MPVSPRSPDSPSKWGAGAARKRDFRWEVNFGGQGGDQAFDTSDEACSVFGFKHNDGIRFGRPGSLWYNKRALVLGVHMGNLWIQLEGEVAAKDLKHVHNAAELQEMYGPQLLSEGERRELMSPEVAQSASSAAPPDFRPARDQTELAHFEYAGVMGTFEFDGTEAACARFGVSHGETLRAGCGSERGKQAYVIGVNNGNLWVHFFGDRRATACHYCSNEAELQAKYGWQKVVAGPRIPPGRQTAAPAAPAPPHKTAQHSDPGQHLPQVVSQHQEPTPVPRESLFEYPVPFGLTQGFDKSREALAPYEVEHGDVVKCTKGMSAGKEAVVIGVCNSSLWIHEKGDRAAHACKYCTNAVEIAARYGFRKIDHVHLEENTPYYTGAVSEAKARQQEAEAILSRSLVDEPWREGAQPQTYRFLRSYAKWRLPKSAPRGQAFMLYYVHDTATRTTEALENLAVLRKFWALRREQGHKEFVKPFSEASEKEIYRCLQQVPLQALTILSATT